MFTFEVVGLLPLRTSLLPLLDISEFSDIECSPRAVSLIQWHDQQPTRFTAAVQMLRPFFDCMSDRGDFHSRTRILSFIQILCNMSTTDLHTVVLLPNVHTTGFAIFTTGAGDLQFCTPLMLQPPEVEDTDASDDGELFFGINATDFREIAKRYSAPSAKIYAIASASQIKFFVTNNGIIEEIILTAELDQYVGAGLELGVGEGEVEFSFGLNPVEFFHKTSLLTKFVWFFRSDDSHTIMKFIIGRWIQTIVYYHDDYMIVLPNRVKFFFWQ